VNIEEFSFKLDPLIQSTLEFSEKLNRITNEVESQLQISKSIFRDIRVRADKILNIENKIRNGIEDAVIPLGKNIHAVGKGIDAFWRRFRNK
jgi:predicted phage-related endonuclease